MVRKQPSINEIAGTRYKDLLRYLRYRVRDPVEAQDIAQEAFMRLLRRQRDELIEKPEAYLFRIAANLAYEHRLQDGRRPVDADTDGALSDRAGAPESRVVAQERLTRVNRAFAQLAPLPRAALLLQRRDGLSYDEIAEHLGTTRHMVKKYLTRAMTACRAAMKDYEDE